MNNELISKKAAIFLGIFGMLGSLILFAGDMLFYFKGDSSDLIANMATVSSGRIILSGVFALLSSWFYVVGTTQVFYAFQPARPIIRWTAFYSLVMIVIAYGVVHGAYVAIATSAKTATELGLQPNALSELAISVNNAIRKLVYLPFGLFTVFFTIGVWLKQTHYPRWILFFSPIVPFLIKAPIINLCQGRMKTIIGGGYLNFILLLFFIASTIALLNSDKNSLKRR